MKSLQYNQREDKTSNYIHRLPGETAYSSVYGKAFLVVRLSDFGARHLRIILGLLLMNNVDNIIHSNQAPQAIFSIYNWQSEQVIPGNKPCHFFLVSIDLYLDHIMVHQISHAY